VVAAVGAGFASWTIASSNASQGAVALGGDDGIFVADELNALLLSDEELEGLRIPGTVSDASSEYGNAPYEASLECAYVIGQTPFDPAGARSIEISDDSIPSFWQRVVQFPDADAAAATFALVASGAAHCTSFTDDLGTPWEWVTVTSRESPGLIAGYAGAPGEPDRVIVVALISNAMSFIYADTNASSLSPAELARVTGEAIRARLTS
jgi:hypothetical protein